MRLTADYTSDVTQYFSNLGQSMNIPLNNVLVDGASALPDSSSQYNDEEQAGDIDVVASMAPSLQQIVVYITPDNPFLVGVYDVDALEKFVKDPAIKVLSISFAWPQNSQTQTDIPHDSQLFEEMAADGQSVFVAAGDNNAWGPASTNTANYPADDKYVTSVGGTVMTTTSAGGPWFSAVAWGGGSGDCVAGKGSGGGISPNSILIPRFQQLAGVINASNGGSTVYRNGPDVAAEANCDNYAFYDEAHHLWGGTSVAAPTWAGLTALADEAGVEYGTAPKGVGRIDEQIYPIGLSQSYSTYFHDVYSGNNNTYNAVNGYDLVTGWGSPVGWNLIYELAGVTQTQSPSLNQTETNGPATCGNALAGYHNACWIELTVTATVASGQTLYVNGQQQNSGYTFTETEDWGTGSCQNTPDGNLCFGWATFPGQTFYATQSGYGNSEQIKSD